MSNACDLTQRRCVPCEGGVPPLDAAAVEDLAPRVPQWTVGDNGTALERGYTFKNFLRAMQWVNAVAYLAEQEGHHPDINVQWNRVALRLTTHAAKGLTENDFILAAKLDALAPS